MRRIDLRRDDGVAMTEFALILPVFVLIVAGLLAFGRVFFYWIEANHLASETARWAVVDRNPYAPTLCSRRLRTARRPSSARTPRSASRGGVTVKLGEPLRCRSEAVHLPPDPRHRQDHDPRFLDDARRELPERCDTHRLHRDVGT